jgi:signal transduction histidine kinase
LQITEALENYKNRGALEYDNPPSDYQIVLPAGNKKNLRGMGKMILSPEGKICKIVGTVQDVTENIRQIEELKKLSESDVQKNNFIAMASHELKTPITSIKGMCNCY